MAMNDNRPRTILSGQPHDGINVTLAGTVYKGDPIGYSAGWVQAQALYTAPIAALLFAGQDGVSGDKIKAFRECLLFGFDTVTAGAPIYLSATAGKFTDVCPSSPYAVHQALGSATKTSASTATIVEIPVSCNDALGTMQVQRVAADNAASYVQQWMALAGASAYAIRAVERVVAGVAAANAYGLHATLAFSDGSDVTGLGCAIRATLESTASQVLQGTLCALQLDSFLGATVTFSGNAGAAFIRLNDVGATVMPFFLDITSLATGASNAFTDGDTNHDTDSGVLRVNSAAGVRYIKLYT